MGAATAHPPHDGTAVDAALADAFEDFAGRVSAPLARVYRSWARDLRDRCATAARGR